MKGGVRSEVAGAVLLCREQALSSAVTRFCGCDIRLWLAFRSLQLGLGMRGVCS